MRELGEKIKIDVVYPYGDDKDGEYLCPCGGYLKEVTIYNGSEVCHTNGGVIEDIYKCPKCSKYYQDYGGVWFEREDVVYDSYDW